VHDAVADILARHRRLGNRNDGAGGLIARGVGTAAARDDRREDRQRTSEGSEAHAPPAARAVPTLVRPVRSHVAKARQNRTALSPGLSRSRSVARSLQVADYGRRRRRATAHAAQAATSHAIGALRQGARPITSQVQRLDPPDPASVLLLPRPARRRRPRRRRWQFLRSLRRPRRPRPVLRLVFVRPLRLQHPLRLLLLFPHPLHRLFSAQELVA